jgi:predicted deacylase
MAQVTEALDILSTILTTVANATAQAVSVSATIKQAQLEGRTTLTDVEWAAIQSTQATSRKALADAIQAALASAGV